MSEDKTPGVVTDRTRADRGYRTPKGFVEWWLEFALVLCVGVMCFIAGAWLA